MAEGDRVKVAFLGTGLMGYPMAERLLKSGYPLTAYNRTRERAEGLADLGARIAAGPAEAVAEAECVLVMLLHAPATREVLLSAEVRPLLEGRTALQMGTIGPQESRGLQQEIESLGGEYLEAPVLGSIPEARAGRLIVMVGATQAQYARWLPLLRCYGREPKLVGPVGQAAALKLGLNQLIASMTTAFGFSLRLVSGHGVGPDTFMQVLRDSALYARTFDKKLPRMRQADFSNPNFPLTHMRKDVTLIMEAAREVGLDTSPLEAVEAVLARAVARGFGELDYSALVEGLALKPADGAQDS